MKMKPRIICGFILLLASISHAATQTTTTTYQYNADGALAAVTTQVDANAANTIYLTWDNFQPDMSDPTSGTVSTANGNLVAYGPSPGTAGATAQFSYDQRNRLTSTVVAGLTTVAYDYHPASRMASATLVSNDSLEFFYDTAPNQHVANVYQSSTQTWSSYLDQVTYLSDGTEQVRFQPRKDVSGVYVTASESFAPLAYAPYGEGTAGAAAPVSSAYDMAANPFQYAGEYADPTWGGYYLRNRWYHPVLETFLSRDPVDAVHRYGYAAGNPVGNTDPSGLSSYHRDFGRYLEKALRPLTTGVGGLIAPLFAGVALTPLEILASPGQFWHGIAHDSHGEDIFLAGNIVLEAVGEYYGFSLARKAILGGALGVGQSVASGFNGARRAYSWYSFAQGLEVSANFEGVARYADAKYHFQSDRMSADQVNELVTQYQSYPSGNEDALAFRMFPRRPTGPIEEWLQRVRGPQEEYLVTISSDRVRIAGRNDYFQAQFQKGFDPQLSAIDNIRAAPAARLNLDFGDDPGFRWVGYTRDESRGVVRTMRAEDRGVSQTKYLNKQITGGQPERLPQAGDRTQSARYAARMRQRLGLGD
jgi:RHS repeat-associated protein